MGGLKAVWWHDVFQQAEQLYLESVNGYEGDQREKKNYPRKQGKKEGETDGCCAACYRAFVQAMPVKNGHVMHG
jgi:hypothetical protein